jgi:hypothetical protein
MPTAGRAAQADRTVPLGGPKRQVHALVSTARVAGGGLVRRLEGLVVNAR